MPTATEQPAFGEHLLKRKAPFRRALREWYGREQRQLSWRGGNDPYAIWISEIVLQQTRVDQGTPYIERFLNAFPDVHALASAHLDEVLKLWEGLGYYTRARNLHKAARVVVNDRNGVLPDTAEAWQTLPGIGRYTAGAIASIAFDEPAPVVDGNVKRVLARLTSLEDSIDDTNVTNRMWTLAAELVKGKDPGEFNQATMELGAQICTPRGPQCEECPVSKYCLVYKAGTQNEIPIRRKKKTTPHHEIVVAAIQKNGRYLLGQRPPEGLLGGLWELPGGKVKSGETHDSALTREIKEELGLNIAIGGLVATVNHAYSHFKITLTVYKCTPGNAKPKPNAHTSLKWVRPSDFKNYAFPKANHKFLHLL